MLEALEAERPGATRALRTDAITELESWHDLRVRTVPESQTDSGCSVAGAYVDDEVPPVIAVALSASRGRQQFTALHELGHRLLRTTARLADILIAEDDAGLLLEEAACNSFAGEVLLPDELVDAHIADEGLTASAVDELWRASREFGAPGASRAAACVRASERLTAPGHIILLDSDGIVSFAASRVLPPPRRGSDQSGIAVVREALGRTPMQARGRTQLSYRDGITGDELYIQCAEMDGYLVAVLVTDHAPWEGFSPPSAEQGPAAPTRICGHCGHEFSTFRQPCSRCGAPECPACSRCECIADVATRQCTTCFVTKPLAMFDGDSTDCLDCD
jgi:Zn-dependent peptidase ImmA (M78 family)